jgi:hypothetical protein
VATFIMKMGRFNKIMTIQRCSRSGKNLVSSIMTKRPTTAIIKLITDQWLSSRTMPGMMVSGSSEKISDRAKEDRFGLMDLCTKVGGKTTRPTAKEDSFMLMEMFMTVSGLMIRHMDLVFIAILMELNTRVTGKKINNMAMDSKLGLMVLDMKANIFKERNMAMEGSHGLMAALTMESLSKTTFKVKESIIGLTRENTMALG